jgi:hypothetical protein
MSFAVRQHILLVIFKPMALSPFKKIAGYPSMLITLVIPLGTIYSIL